jgi:2-C-methyl-D-erythritol 4-phosphate cytidylyltransferase
MHLLIPAAGSGKRMGATGNKLLLEILGLPLLAWTLKAALASRQIEWIGIIGQEYDFEKFQKIVEDLAFSKPLQLIEGGTTRQESVYNGLQSLPVSAKHVLIHDGARCLATPELFDRCSEALLTCSGLIAAISVKDTIKVVNSEGYIVDTPNREQLWAAQTPQGFSVDLLKECHAKGRSLGWEVTDDAALLEKCQLPVKIVEGEETNLKVTTPVDLAIAEYILKQRLSSY